VPDNFSAPDEPAVRQHSLSELLGSLGVKGDIPRGFVLNRALRRPAAEAV
jgi:hypothetical protein